LWWHAIDSSLASTRLTTAKIMPPPDTAGEGGDFRLGITPLNLHLHFFNQSASFFDRSWQGWQKPKEEVLQKRFFSSEEGRE
jgi:hypothetical protein